jgi:GT2 family glycosyltransferase
MRGSSELGNPTARDSAKPGRPLLSIIIASYNAGATIEACLESLRSQTAAKKLEILLVDSSEDGTADLVKERFPEVKLLRFSERKFCGDARNLGIVAASARLVAFIDADCRAAPDWAEEILEAHESPHLAIGGAIANGNPESHVGWAAYFCEFSQWMPGAQAEFMDDIAGASMSYKREAFERFGRFIEGTYSSDTDFHRRLGKAGLRLRFQPTIVVFHRNLDRMSRFLRHEYHHGCAFARVRARGGGFPGWRRMIYALGSPLIPLRLLLRMMLGDLRKTGHMPHFFKALPLLLLGLYSWSLGECVGYIEGGHRHEAAESNE